MAFTPREFHSEDEPLVSPTELLKKTDAIVVSQRVYVTVSGMEANTTYFMKIRIKQGDSSGETTSTTAPPTYAGAIAVKTLAEGEDITCSGTCRSEEVTMVPSASCPRPVLEQVDNACCPEWRCHPAENGCRYKRLILQDGEQVREGCEESCRCSRGNLTCSAICEPDGIPPRAGCSLKTLPDHCCRVWMCLPARKPVKSVSLNFGITFRGLCATPVGDFKSRFKTVFLNFLQDRVYVNKSSERRTVCDRMEAFITCPVSNPTTSRRKREVSDIKFDLRIVLNIGDFDSMTAAKQTLDKMATALVDVFNGTDVTITEGFTTYVTTGSISIIGPKYDCDPYYVLVGNTCVQAGVTQPPTSHIDLSLSPISVSTDSAILAWDSLTDSEIRYVTGLQIEYREEAYFDWNQTGRIDPHVTRHTLTQLQAARKYRARLVVLTNMSKVDRLPMTAVKFQTKAFDVFTSTIIVLKEVKVDDKSVSIRWSPFPANIIDVISAMEVTYKKMDMTSAKTLHQGLDLTASECKLTGLDPSTIYVAQINILFKNGTVTRSGSIHFVTRAKVSGSNDTIIMPLAVSAVVVVCVLAIVLITCWLWRRNRKRNSHETAFENKTFGIHIENDGKTLSARP